MLSIEKKPDFVRTAFYFIFVIGIFFNIHTSLPPKNELLVMVHNPFLSYDLRERLKMGSPFYEYIQFIKKEIPEDATIILPPQNSGWGMYGNFFYMQHYLYPRTLIGGYGGVGDLDSADYALLVEGDSLWPDENRLSSLEIDYLQMEPQLGVVKLR